MRMNNLFVHIYICIANISTIFSYIFISYTDSKHIYHMYIQHIYKIYLYIIDLNCIIQTYSICTSSLYVIYTYDKQITCRYLYHTN